TQRPFTIDVALDLATLLVNAANPNQPKDVQFRGDTLVFDGTIFRPTQFLPGSQQTILTLQAV
ncbi:MAG: hypothetical protein QOJ99_5942, partial [Bryobacterales bacterium]|nr:hypothetical protein [Bryobacterales bacterium]